MHEPLAMDDATDPDALAGRFERNMHLLPGVADHYPPLREARWAPLDDAARLDRAQGCLLGLAIGDAMGAARGALKLAPGQWSAPTAMAVCLAQSLASARVPGLAQGLDQYDLMERLARWMSTGENTAGGQCVGLDGITRAAIERFVESDEPAAGSVDGDSAGNGSLVREAPLAIACVGQSDVGRFLANKQSRATHGTLECLDACELFTAQLIDALSGADRAQATRPRFMKLAPNALALNGGEWKTLARGDVRAGPYVIDTLQAALWAVWNADGFHDAVRLAVDLAVDAGGDAAAVGAVAGQLAGALYGASAIPPEPLRALALRDTIQDIATQLATPAAVRG